MADRFIRLPAVKEMSGLSRTGIYAGMKNNSFPQSCPIGARAIAWRLSDIEKWMNERAEMRRAA
ncbi:MAG TPA: AlpA family phage regulatory protein [Rhodanobacter sp.]|nr:AlpA family phage regulatory protein [Rhodanobacter sp.]